MYLAYVFMLSKRLPAVDAAFSGNAIGGYVQRPEIVFVAPIIDKRGKNLL